MSISELVEEIAVLPSTSRLTNPYAPLDDPLATIRRANLARYLLDMQRYRPRVLLLAEAPGYRGCALSGIPITSERIMLRGIAKWGLFGEGYHPTSLQPGGVAEMTATILWSTLIEHADQPPLLWNTLPLHPHQPGNPRSNRTPTKAEQQIGLPLLDKLCTLFDFELILAVGRTAQRSLAERGYSFIPLRHPAQGGKSDFVAGIRRVFSGQGKSA